MPWSAEPAPHPGRERGSTAPGKYAWRVFACQPASGAAAALAALGLLLAPSAAAAPQQQPVAVAPAPRLIAPASIPTALLAAAQAMEAVHVSSERFSAGSALSSAGAHLPHSVERFLQLVFDTRISGEATSSPPAGAFRLTIFGQTLRLRLVRGRAYLYEPAIAARDGGRPWIELRGGGFEALFGGLARRRPFFGGAPESFAGLARAVRAARAVRELGAGVVDGQAVDGYRLVVPSASLQPQQRRVGQAGGVLAGAFGGGRLPPPPPPDENVLLEVFVTPTGVPVRAHVSLQAEGFSFSALTDVYAIDFPLVVAPPPRRLTIGANALERIRRASRRQSR